MSTLSQFDAVVAQRSESLLRRRAGNASPGAPTGSSPDSCCSSGLAAIARRALALAAHLDGTHEPGRISTCWAAWLLGGAITALPVGLAVLRPGRTSTRHVIAAGQMLMSALLIHLSGGRIETHFHVFGSLAFLAFYRDWTVFVPATVVVAADHFLRGLYWPESVYGVAERGLVALARARRAGCCSRTPSSIALLPAEPATRCATSPGSAPSSRSANERTEQTVVERTAELQASEERFRSLSAASPIGIFETDRGRARHVHQRALGRDRRHDAPRMRSAKAGAPPCIPRTARPSCGPVGGRRGADAARACRSSAC